MRWSLRLLAAAIASSTVAAQQPPAGQGPRPTEDTPERPASGVVPPGVKLVPTMPGPGTPHRFEFPQAANKTLANGLRVFVVSDHRNPAIAARLVILSAGSIRDPERMPGVAQMTANMLTQGTARRSAKDVADAIDFVGGTLTAAAGKDATTVTLDVVKKDLNVGLDLMSDVVLHPAFRAEELDRQRQQLLSGLTLQYSDPGYLASVVFGRAVYGDSAYGRPQEGTPETARKLQRDDLAKFHDTNYAANQALLAFAGDITSEEAFAVAEKYFGQWPKQETATTTPASPAPVQGQHIWLINKPDAVQTQIRVGKLGIRRGDPDYIPVEVTNRIFGGGYNSRLNTEVRIKKGLTYGAFSSFTPHRFAGSLTVGTFTRTDTTVEATKLVVDLIGKMSSGDVTPQEMDFARDYLAGAYPIASETAEEVADRVLTVAAFDLPADYNRTYPDRIRSVSPAQVDAVAKKYFTTDNLDIVLAGNVDAFREALKKEFPSAQYSEISFDRLDVLSADLRKPKEKTAEITAKSLAEGKDILLAAAKAAGGESLTSISSMSVSEKGQFFGMGSEIPITVKWLIAYPDRSHLEVSFGPNKATQVCDGKSAWVATPQGTRDATPVISEFERGIALYGGGWGLYKRALAGKVEANAIGDEEIDGKKTTGVAVEGPFGKLKLYFDPGTHLLTAARYESAGPQGATAQSEQHWSDYREVEGRKFAFSSVIYRDGAKFDETSAQDLKLNPGIKDEDFAEPQAPASR
jgi:zinc protease